MKKIFQTHPSRLLLSLLFAIIGGGINAWGVTYELQQVTSVEAGGLYVFEQGGHVMINTVSSSALQTTDSYETTGLEGTETYVWTLETATGGFYMKNVNEIGLLPYLNNASSTNVSFGNSASSIWAFNFQSDNTVLIQNTKNSNRFLGYTNSTSYAYKAYATSNLSSYPHAIKVYQLVEEGSSSAIATTTTIDNSGITNTDVYTSTAAGSLSASVTASGNAVAGATVSWSSSNKDVATIASDGTVTLVGAGSVIFTASYEGVANTYQASSDTYEMTVTDSTPIPTYTVTLGDDSSTLTETSGGAGVTLPSRDAVGRYTFAGWSETNVTAETTTAPIIIPAGAYNPTGNVMLYPVYTKTEGGASENSSNIFASGSYDNGTITWVAAGIVSITQEQNGAQTAPNSSYVSSPRWYSGNLITITPSVSINSISVTATSEGYASTLATSTYDNATATSSGTTATITPNNGSMPITITMGGQSRLSSLTVNYAVSTTYYWSTPSTTERVAQPIITIAGGVFVSSKLVTITCETEDAAIQYSTDNGESWLSYSAPFSISATTTVQAKATKSGMDDSHVAEATFTKETVLEGLAGLAAQTNTSNASYYVNLTNAQVTYVTGNNGFMEDATAGIYVYSASPVLNKVYNGIFQVTYQVYNGLPELKAITAVEGTITDGSDKAATEVALSTLTSNWNANLGRKVQLRATLTSAGDLAEGYSLYKYDNSITTEGLKTYTLVGYPYINSNNPQFRIISAEEVQLQDNSIIMVGPDYTIDVSVSGGGEVNMTSAAASHGTLQSEVVLASTTVDASKYDFAGNVLTVHDVTEGGVIVIRYWVEADTEYNAAELLVPIYLKANPIIAYDGETESTAYDTPYTIDTDLISGGDITVSSSNTDVATVDGLTITPVAVGSTTITINTAETNIWHAGSATFTLNVTPVVDYATLPFEYDGNGTGTLPKGLTVSGLSTYSSSPRMQFNGSGDYLVLKIDQVPGTLSFDIKGNSFSGGTFNVQTSADGENYRTIGTYTALSSTTKTEMTSNLDADARYIKWVYTEKDKGNVALGNIKLIKERKVTVTNAGYATYCSKVPLDFEGTGITAYVGTADGEKLTFTPITQVPANTGLLLVCAGGTTADVPVIASAPAVADNCLTGVTTAKTLEADDYILNVVGGQAGFFKAGNDHKNLKANRAYIPASVGAGVKSFALDLEDNADGIEETLSDSLLKSENIYNLAGQRLSKMQKGINIVNGKKVLN